MTGRLLAAIQGLGEYGAVTGGAAGNTSAFGTLVTRTTLLISDHRTAVIVGVILIVAFFWWFSSK